MNENLENTTVDEDDLLEVVPETGLTLDEELLALGNDDIDTEFDEDGNLIDNTDEGAETVTEDAQGTEETTEDIDTTETTAETGKKLSPAELKIIALKKEKQALEQQLKEKKETETKAQADADRETILNRFIEQGWEPDTAKVMTETELRIKSLEMKEAIMDFREANTEVFTAYPQAKADIATIMKKARLTGMTAEQICRGLYATTIPDNEKRALDAINGKSTREVKDTTNVSSAIRGNNTIDSVGLTPSELREKRILEQRFNGGNKLTDKEYRQYAK